MRPFLLALLLLLPLPAAADVIWLKNGDRLTGEVQANEKSLILTFPFGGEVEIPRSAVKRWRARQASAPKLSNKGINLALLAPDDEKWHLTGSEDINLKIKDSTNRTNSLSTKGKLELENPDWRSGLEGEYEYDTSNGITTDHHYRLKPRVDYFITDRWYWRGTIDYQRDLQEPVYLEVDYNTGPGYRVWKESKKKLEFLLLGGLREAYWRANPTFYRLFNSDHVAYPTMSLAWDYQHRIEDTRFELFSSGEYIHYLSQPAEYLTYERTVDGELGMRYYISDNLRLSWSANLTWDDIYVDYQGDSRNINGQEWRQLLSLGVSF